MTNSVPSVPTAAAPMSPLAAAFDMNRAWKDLVTQVEFGPRIPGSTGHGKTIEYIRTELEKAGFDVEIRQAGPVKPTLTGQEVDIYNIIGTWEIGRARRLFFSAHYDTRPISDQAKTAREIIQPVPGANDGASGVAVLLGMARAIAEHPPKNVGVYLVFHDVEDLGARQGQKVRDPYYEYCIGSRYLANDWLSPDGFEAGVNFDMVADADLHFPQERYSTQKAPETVDRFWGIGERLWPEVFAKKIGRPVIDDHLPYLAHGWPCINLIDFDFAPWHTPRDTPESCSPQSLYITGTTGLEFISDLDSRPLEKP